MLQLALWPILAVIMGLAFLTVAAFLGTIVWNTSHLMRDMIVGDDGQMWCPVHKCEMKVHGVPRGSLLTPFVGLNKCQQFGAGHIRCGKTCLVQINQTTRLTA